MSQTLSDFVQEIRQLLGQINWSSLDNHYVNLADIDSAIEIPDLMQKDTLPTEPLVDVFHLILEAIARCQVDLVKYGINEICKSFIQQVNKYTEKDLATYYLRRLELIFQRCLLSDFPYQNEVWNYLGSCLNSVGLYLYELRLESATKELLQTFFHMGKLAAQQGLQTSSTQGYFRVLENKAREQGFDDLAASAKNFRFNLELY